MGGIWKYHIFSQRHDTHSTTERYLEPTQHHAVLATLGTLSSAGTEGVLGSCHLYPSVVRRSKSPASSSRKRTTLTKPQDYNVTYYSAEIVNTLTNLLFIYLAYKGVKSCRKQGHDMVFHVAYYGYFLVGFGSFMFHSTLKCKFVFQKSFVHKPLFRNEHSGHRCPKGPGTNRISLVLVTVACNPLLTRANDFPRSLAISRRA